MSNESHLVEEGMRENMARLASEVQSLVEFVYEKFNVLMESDLALARRIDALEGKTSEQSSGEVTKDQTPPAQSPSKAKKVKMFESMPMQMDKRHNKLLRNSQTFIRTVDTND
jgi:hypothetical protein